MKIIYIYLFVALNLISCFKNRTEDKELMECINQPISENFKEFFTQKELDVNFFDSIRKFEKILMDKKILLENNRKGYIDLVTSLNDKNNESVFRNLYLENKKENSFFHHYSTNASTISFMYDHCIASIISVNKDLGNLKKIKQEYEKIFLKGGFPDIDILSSLVNEIDFNGDFYRLSLVNLIYLHIYLKYDEGAIRRRNLPEPKF